MPSDCVGVFPFFVFEGGGGGRGVEKSPSHAEIDLV